MQEYEEVFASRLLKEGKNAIHSWHGTGWSWDLRLADIRRRKDLRGRYRQFMCLCEDLRISFENKLF